MLVSIQYLRAIAAFLVVGHHFHVSQTTFDWPGVRIWEQGEYGVDVFFVISGFIMWVTTADGASPANFLRRRLTRIAPLYWLTTIVSASADLARGSFSIIFLAASLFFIPMRDPFFGDIAPMYPVGWTLNFEMAFYLIFTLGLFLNRGKRFWAIAGVLILGAALAPLAASTNATPALFYTRSIILEFVYGMAIARAFIALRDQGWAHGRVAAIVGLAAVGVGAIALLAPVLVDDAIPRGFRAGLPAMLIVAGGVALEPWAKAGPVRLFVTLGDASYATYLTHLFVIRVVASPAMAGVIFPAFGLPATAALAAAPTIVMMVAYLAAAHVIGILVHRHVETPLNTFVRQRVDLRSRPRPAAPPPEAA
ncbi:MAG: acyltransferase family protein [Alphaproteobacteria bacterium]|nr:acyltransferase family protein [Alphaproteobacteria bacterium]